MKVNAISTDKNTCTMFTFALVDTDFDEKWSDCRAIATKNDNREVRKGYNLFFHSAIFKKTLQRSFSYIFYSIFDRK